MGVAARLETKAYEITRLRESRRVTQPGELVLPSVSFQEARIDSFFTFNPIYAVIPMSRADANAVGVFADVYSAFRSWFIIIYNSCVLRFLCIFYRVQDVRNSRRSIAQPFVV